MEWKMNIKRLKFTKTNLEKLPHPESGEEKQDTLQLIALAYVLLFNRNHP